MTSAIVHAPSGLLAVEKAREFLAQSRSVDEVRDVADKAKAVALYLRSRDASIESQNDAAEIRLRAERRLGQLSDDIKDDARGRPAKNAAKPAAISKAAKLKEHGFKSEREARRYEALAAIPENKFEAFVKETRAKGERITASAPLKLAKLEDKAKLATKLRAAPVPQPSGRFHVIVADPPWAYAKRAGDVTHRADLPYPSMTT